MNVNWIFGRVLKHTLQNYMLMILVCFTYGIICDRRSFTRVQKNVDMACLRFKNRIPLVRAHWNACTTIEIRDKFIFYYGSFFHCVFQKIYVDLHWMEFNSIPLIGSLSIVLFFSDYTIFWALIYFFFKSKREKKKFISRGSFMVNFFYWIFLHQQFQLSRIR